LDFGSEGLGLSAELAAHSPATGIVFRQPTPLDGPQVTALVADCPPLDVNSAYCNLLQCSDFAGTCVVAEQAGRVVGWISAYRPPASPESLFIWQVAVHERARGESLGRRMIEWLLTQPQAQGASRLTTTITAENRASWTMFRRFAQRHRLVLTKFAHFEREIHFAGAHDTEWQVAIDPLERARQNLGGQETR
jgi:L-2,4-diaminobutyric acid acetyltransferase